MHKEIEDLYEMLNNLSDMSLEELQEAIDHKIKELRTDTDASKEVKSYPNFINEVINDKDNDMEVPEIIGQHFTFIRDNILNNEERLSIINNIILTLMMNIKRDSDFYTPFNLDMIQVLHTNKFSKLCDISQYEEFGITGCMINFNEDIEEYGDILNECSNAKTTKGLIEFKLTTLLITSIYYYFKFYLRLFDFRVMDVVTVMDNLLYTKNLKLWGIFDELTSELTNQVFTQHILSNTPYFKLPNKNSVKYYAQKTFLYSLFWSYDLNSISIDLKTIETKIRDRCAVIDMAEFKEHGR